MNKIKQNNISILIIDNDTDYSEIIEKYLSLYKFETIITNTLPKGIEILKSTNIDIVITNIKMPKAKGRDLIKIIKDSSKEAEIIILTDNKSLDVTFNSFQKRAEEYLAKPFTEDRLISTVNRSLKRLELKKSKKELILNEPIKSSFNLVGQSNQIQKIFNEISKASLSMANVLISGESGTGKELVARAIHYSSTRAKAPFVAVHCAGIPDTLLESELFGYEKGSFTGAEEARSGFFQTANGGTIFLDEISETTSAFQVKLLRVVQEKQYFTIGGRSPNNANVRIISATNKNLVELIKLKQFREDLYYRLNVIPIEIPPLRERKEDILFLTRFFLYKLSEKYNKSIPVFTERAFDALKKYNWPGNVRELENVIERMIVMHDKKNIIFEDLPLIIQKPLIESSGTNFINLNKTLKEIEIEYIKKVLSFTNNNKTYAAKILGIDRKTLLEKLKKEKTL